MRTFAFFIHDSRYSVPTLHWADFHHEEDARVQAQGRLDESPYHLAVEVLEDETPLFRVDRG